MKAPTPEQLNDPEWLEQIKKISDATRYNATGNLIWTSLERRRDRVGKIAGTKSKTDGYMYVKTDGKRISVHRVVFFKHHGYVPPEIDHINRVRHDNRIENLRDPVTHTKNLGNQSLQVGRSSKYKGVCWDKNRSKWTASTKINSRSVFLGRFDKEEDAAAAYNAKAIELFGEFAYVNAI